MSEGARLPIPASATCQLGERGQGAPPLRTPSVSSGEWKQQQAPACGVTVDLREVTQEEHLHTDQCCCHHSRGEAFPQHFPWA